jgi:hypothetical protein
MTTNEEDPLIVTPTLLEISELLEYKLANVPKAASLFKKWQKEITKLQEILDGGEDTWLMWQNPYKPKRKKK